MRISDWSSDVCSSDLLDYAAADLATVSLLDGGERLVLGQPAETAASLGRFSKADAERLPGFREKLLRLAGALRPALLRTPPRLDRSEEHTSELQSLMRISYAVFCLKKKKN